MTDFHIRKAQTTDFAPIADLYRRVSQTVGGLARTHNEITDQYVKNFIEKSAQNGLQWVVAGQEKMIAEIHCYKLEPQVFAHIFSELTIAVDSQFQGQGWGKKLFQTLLNDVQHNHPDIMRVELIARESNTKAIKLYESLGFVQEGRLQNRIRSGTHQFEADIPMAWFNPDFRK